VGAGEGSGNLSSQFCIVSSARAGHGLGELEAVVQEELAALRATPPTAREVERVVNQTEASFLDRLERAGGFGGKADQLNGYYWRTGNPDWFAEDVGRYKAIAPTDISAAVRAYLRDDARVVLSVVPNGKPELAAAKPSTE